jgi:hypothetical protein
MEPGARAVRSSKRKMRSLSSRRAAPLGGFRLVARVLRAYKQQWWPKGPRVFRLAARVLRAHKRQKWPKGPQVGRIDPQESWAKP